MKKWLAAAFILAAVSFQNASATPVVLGFDDLIQSEDMLAPVPENHGGILWDSGIDWTEGWLVMTTDQAYYPSSSGEFVAFGWLDQLGVTFDAPVQFHGAFFAGFANIAFELYQLGTLVHTSDTLTVNTEETPALWLDSGYSGLIDRVVIRTDNPFAWVMDDFTFTPESPVQEISEPSLVALLLLALTIIGFALKNQRYRSTRL